MTGQSHGPASMLPWKGLPLVSCAAVAVLNFLFFEQEAAHFYFALGPGNCAAYPGPESCGTGSWSHFLVNLHIRYEILILLGLVNTSRKSPILTSITFVYLLMACLSYKEHKVHQSKNHESISSNTVSPRPSTSDS